MIKFEESRKLLLDSYREYVSGYCGVNGALAVLRECLETALRDQYIGKDLNGKRISYIECDVSKFSFAISATLYCMPYEPIDIDEDWSREERKIIAEVNQLIAKNGISPTINDFDSRLSKLKHRLCPIDIYVRLFELSNIAGMNINNIKI